MISKEAKEKWTATKNQWFFKSARYAFEELLNIIRSVRDGVVLMPGYIGQSVREGSGVFDPIRHTKTRYVFYALHEDLSVDVEDLKQKMNDPNVVAVLLIHYFGFPQKCVVDLASLCREKGILLIEDCAHTIGGQFSGVTLGDFGDFSFYSIHKLTASENGGILQVNNSSYTDRFRNVIDNIDVEDLIQYIRTDLNKSSSIRRKNYQLYLESLSRNSKYFDIMFPELEEGVVPINFPIRVKNYSREKMYFQLMEDGIPLVSLYYQMVEELPREGFPVSYNISDSILNLPTHQCINKNDVLTIVDALNHFVPRSV